ncbi:hypothetical protein LP421_26940 [Rhizobium sp. RCAM05350]|nr:hypothetical protein LP421_26940 [Rhizobium sp. RCAM05350]
MKEGDLFFSEGGANALKFFEQLEIINAPAQVIADYEAVHLFLLEITEHLTKSCREFFKHVIDDPYPGYQVHKKRVTKILPNHNVDALMPRLRYDDDLNVD